MKKAKEKKREGHFEREAKVMWLILILPILLGLLATLVAPFVFNLFKK